MDSSPVVIDRTGQDIHGELARVRAQGPVTRVVLPGGVAAWSVTGYEVARQVLADHRFSKDPRKHWTAFIDGEIDEDFPLIGWVLMENLTTAYGHDHTRLRKLTSNAFTPRRVDAMRPRVEKIAAQLLDDLGQARPGEVVDLKARFAHPLPAQVICDLFGVPAEAQAGLLEGGEVNVDTTITPEEAAANVEEWHQVMYAFVESKRQSAGDDLTTDLIAAHDDDGSRLTNLELVGTLHLMLATGTEPVMNLLSNAVRMLLTHPEQLAAVRSGAVPWSAVIEETLRVEAPVAHLPFRFAVEDVEIGGVRISKGDPVLMGFAGVGRDPDLHGDSAATFDVLRDAKEHLSFGHGIYRCIGSQLALLEAEIALPGLFDRFPGMALAVDAADLEPQGSFIMNGTATLPVVLTPA
jgi:cytochrome P450